MSDEQQRKLSRRKFLLSSAAAARAANDLDGVGRVSRQPAVANRNTVRRADGGICVGSGSADLGVLVLDALLRRRRHQRRGQVVVGTRRGGEGETRGFL